MHVKEKVSDLVRNYNKTHHRKIKPEKGFGKPFLQDTARYILTYELDSGEKMKFGFKQRGEYFAMYGEGHETLNVDEAIENLEKQLE